MVKRAQNTGGKTAGATSWCVIEALFVGLGDVCQLVDELAEVGEPGGGVGESCGGFGGAGVGLLFYMGAGIPFLEFYLTGLYPCP